jgi:hypothetical protein
MAMASRPSSGSIEIEAADDFATTSATAITGLTFTGLIPTGAALSSITEVAVEIYRGFPLDSDVGRTSGPPTFSTALVLTRVNSPSDTAFVGRDSAEHNLTFTPSVTQASFTAINSVLNGINPKPNQRTGGEGAVTGQEVSFNVVLTSPVNLPAGHYFFVPQVKLASGEFRWLSAPKPIVAQGTPFPVGTTDFQAWIRNANLAPDWLRVGTDIVGGTTSPTFNGTFSLSGATCGAISLAPVSLPSATAGTPFAAPLAASGGTAPYSFTESGALPSGVSLPTSGSLSGIPMQAGSFPISVTATDATGCQGTERLTLTVAQSQSGGTPPPSGGQPPPPAQPPVISSARLSTRAFRAAAHGASLTRKRTVPIGTTIRYKDSKAAVTTFTVLRLMTGHKKKRSCLRGQPHKHQLRCTLRLAVGSFAHTDVAGAVSVFFSGRVRGHELPPGRYLLMLTPRANGHTGRTVTLSFQIVSAG